MFAFLTLLFKSEGVLLLIGFFFVVVVSVVLAFEVGTAHDHAGALLLSCIPFPALTEFFSS